MKTRLYIVLLTAFGGAVLSASSAASAAPILDLSLNFVNNSGGATAYTGGGVLDATSRTWSTMTGSGVGGGGGFSVGPNTYGSVGVTIPDYGDFSSNTSPTLNLFDGYVYSGTANAGAESIVLSDLDPLGSYSLAVYAAWGWSTQANAFTVTDALGTTASQGTTGANTSAFTAGVNYVTFTGLKPTAGGVLTINLNNGASNTTEWFVSGLELTHIVIPAPAALPAGLALLGLAATRRRLR